ncbi:hypothetical protein PWG71_13520 [Nocardiopsis sp. N85]|uniref:hypothetical protein n=1 Tax=Nocardiopsis sp. N85 TaxID=3029400 RepID=UPI00237F8215|nr:hypothetical protein [Nocardiopsis sp. N85]MDE3722409.1 hypothetical protein [Nocardiopsis sp. N85]
MTVTRDEDLWAAMIGGLPEGRFGGLDHVNFSDIREEVPEAIADLTDSAPEDFTITWRHELDGRDVTEELSHFIEVEERFHQVVEEHESGRSRALDAMREAGLSQRTMAGAVNLSHQRVQQSLNGLGGTARRGRKPGERTAV